MSDSKELLNSEEVEFLLDAGTPGSNSSGGNSTSSNKQGKQQSPASASPQQVVTMRGDLEQIQLADIFQTLGISKMEGMLAVSNPIEQRQVFFRDAKVRILVPQRAVTRRLGQRLVAAGVLDADHLRQALVEQRKKQLPVGELLVENGICTQEQIDEIINMQVTDDLFSLFTWEHGTFEFYKGPCTDPAVLARLETCPWFEVNSLLLEVARRADEWQSILEAITSLDEIPVAAADQQAAIVGLGEDERALVTAADGRSSYREIGEQTMTSLFDAARCARDLVSKGLLVPSTDQQMLAVARWHQEHGHTKQALMVVHALRNRHSDLALPVARELATLLRTCGESSMACAIILQAAQLQTNTTIALELAREARSFNPRDLDALAFLRTTMLAHMAPDSPEVEQVTLQLLDGLLAEGEADRVLIITAEARQLDGATPVLLLREARALAKKKHNAAAIEVLIDAARAFAEAGDRERQIEAYDLALRLDRDRKDIRKTLKQLRLTPRKRMMRTASTVAATLLLLSSGFVWYSAVAHEHYVADAGAQLKAALVAEDMAAARACVEALREHLGACPEVDDLEQQLAFAVANERQRAERATRRLAAEQLRHAAELLATGALDRALPIYAELLQNPLLAVEVRETQRARLLALAKDLGDTAKKLPGLLPRPPEEVMERQLVVDTLEKLRGLCREDQLHACRALLEMRRAGPLPSSIPDELQRTLLELAHTTLPMLEAAVSLRDAYAVAAQRSEAQRRLDPVFKAAIDHEAQLDFEAALTSYRQLLAANAAGEHLQVELQGKVQLLEQITAALERMRAATKDGDYARAARELTQLHALRPDVPFEHVALLPVELRTSVPGATLRWNGARLGTTPFRTSYRPGDANTIEVELPGFEPQRLPLPAHLGVVEILLTLKPAWQIELPQPTHQPLTFGGQGMAFGCDSNGGIFGVDLEHKKVAWRIETGDAAGDLSPPVVIGGDLVVASLEGSVRCLGQATGESRWQRHNLATEFAPVAIGDRLVLATIDRQLLALQAGSGETLVQVQLPDEARGGLVGCGANVVVAFGDGRLQARDGRGLTVVWRCEAGAGQSPILIGSNLAVVQDDGQVVMIQGNSGTTLWQKPLPATTVGRASSDGQSLLLTLDDRLLLLDARDGRESWSARRPEDGWLGPARFIGTAIAAPSRNGSMLVFSTSSTTPRLRLDGDRKAATIAGQARSDVAVTAARRLSVYRQLP